MHSNYIEFLTGAHKRYGKSVLFLDNAAYHKFVPLTVSCKDGRGEIKIMYFFPYTPDLNLT